MSILIAKTHSVCLSGTQIEKGTLVGRYLKKVGTMEVDEGDFAKAALVSFIQPSTHQIFVSHPKLLGMSYTTLETSNKLANMKATVSFHFDL